MIPGKRERLGNIRGDLEVYDEIEAEDAEWLCKELELAWDWIDQPEGAEDES